MSQIHDIARKIYSTEFYDDSSKDGGKNLINSISAWLETNIGQLNILIHSEYRVTENLDVCPRLGPEEIAIFIQLYLKEYYKRKSQAVLKNVTESDVSTGESSFSMSDWIELREGDSQIKRQSLISTPQQKIQAAQAYKSISAEADVKIKEFVQYYNIYKSLPRQVLEEGFSGKASCLNNKHGCETEEYKCYTKTQTETVFYTPTKTHECHEGHTPTITETEKKTVVKTNTETETDTSTNTETQTETITNTETQTGTSTNTETQTDTSTNTETQTETITNTETQTDTSTNTETQTDTSTNTETQTDTSTNTETQTDTSTNTETQTETITNTETQTGTSTNTETQTETITNTETQTDTSTNTETQTETITNTQTQTDTSTNTETQTETSTNTETQTDTSTNTETQTETITNTETQTETITNTQTQTDTSTNTETQTETITNTQTQTDTSTNTETQTETSTNTETQTDTSTNTETQTDTSTNTETQTETSTNTETQTETSTNTETQTETITNTQTQTETITNTQTQTETETNTQTQTETETNTQTQTETETNTQTETITTSFTFSPAGPCCEYGFRTQSISSQSNITIPSSESSNETTIKNIHSDAVGASMCMPRATGNSSSYSVQLKVNNKDFMLIEGNGSLEGETIYMDKLFESSGAHSFSMESVASGNSVCCSNKDVSDVINTETVNGAWLNNEIELTQTNPFFNTVSMKNWNICYDTVDESITPTTYYINNQFFTLNAAVTTKKKIKNNHIIFIDVGGQCYDVVLANTDPNLFDLVQEYIPPTYTSSPTETTCGYGTCAEYTLCDIDEYKDNPCNDASRCPSTVSELEKFYIALGEGELPSNGVYINGRCYSLNDITVNAELCGANSAADCGGSAFNFKNQNEYNSGFVTRHSELTSSDKFDTCSECCACTCSTTCFSCKIVSGVCEMTIPCYT
jgi:hypothetical protein